MNSASILMNLAPATQLAPTAAAPAGAAVTGAEQALTGTGGFDAALAVAQAASSTGDAALLAQAVPVDVVSSLLAQGTVPASYGCVNSTLEAGDEVDVAADANADAAQAGAAAILAQMLVGSAPEARPENALSADSALPQIVAQSGRSMAIGSAAQAGVGTAAAESSEEGVASDGEHEGKGSDALAMVPGPAADPVQPAALVSPDTLAESPAIGPQPQQGSSQSGISAQASILAAASALRDAVPSAASGAPVHATLREPVGTARWADELGNRLVLMSVRGQQHGSLTLSPEHLGPVEVQISVNRETTNVWFGAQHADTRTALAEAMPRLRELLAASGLSLGQSGVSEQSPREGFVPRVEGLGPEAAGIDADGSVEKPAPAWRVWRPGLVDTYA